MTQAQKDTAHSLNHSWYAMTRTIDANDHDGNNIQLIVVREGKTVYQIIGPRGGVVSTSWEYNNIQVKL